MDPETENKQRKRAHRQSLMMAPNGLMNYVRLKCPPVVKLQKKRLN